MNKCDLEETKHVACQKFLYLVYSDDKKWALKHTINSCTYSSMGYTEEGGAPYYYERDKFSSYREYYEVRAGHHLIWTLSERTVPSEFDVKMAAACEELKRRYDSWQKQLQCEAILAALNPKPAEEKAQPEVRPTGFLSKIKQFWKEIGE